MGQTNLKTVTIQCDACGNHIVTASKHIGEVPVEIKTESEQFICVPDRGVLIMEKHDYHHLLDNEGLMYAKKLTEDSSSLYFCNAKCFMTYLFNKKLEE